MNRFCRRATVTTGALLLLTVPGTQASAAPPEVTYRAVELGTLGGSTSIPRAVNKHGDVVGTSTTGAGDIRPFLWRHGRLFDLGTLPGGHDAHAVDINDDGLVVGDSDSASGPRHAVAWQFGAIIDLGVLDGSDTRATGVNNRGQIVGDDTAGHAFLWQHGTMTQIGDFTSGRINQAGQVACWKPATPAVCRWDSGVLTILDTTLTSPVRDTVTDINAEGDVIGFGFPDGRPPLQALLWHDGTRTALTTLHPWESSAVMGINDQLEIVGNRMVGVPATHHEPFVWRDGTISIPSGINPGAYLRDINNAGEIVGDVSGRGVLYRPQNPEAPAAH